jgi:hypothetical protein
VYGVMEMITDTPKNSVVLFYDNKTKIFNTIKEAAEFVISKKLDWYVSYLNNAFKTDVTSYVQEDVRLMTKNKHDLSKELIRYMED